MHIDRDRLRQQNQENESEDSLLELVKEFHKKEEPDQAGSAVVKEPVQEERASEDTLEKMIDDLVDTSLGKDHTPEKDRSDQIEKSTTEEGSSIPKETDAPEEVRSVLEEKKEDNVSSGKRIPAKYLVLGISLLVVLAAVLFKVFMDVSFKPQTTVNAAEHTNVRIYISDNEVDVTNPYLPYDENRVGIILYSDLRVEAECYLPLMVDLAEKGYDCYLPRAFGNQPYLNTEGAISIIRKTGSIKNWLLLGHSHSCDAAVVSALENLYYVRGLVYLGGFSDVDISKTGLSLLSVRGTEDTVTSQEMIEKTKKNNPPSTVYYEVQGGNNSGFLDSPLLPGDSDAKIASEQQIKETSEQIDLFIQDRVQKQAP